MEKQQNTSKFLLPAVNQLYGFGLTDKEMDEITNTLHNLITNNAQLVGAIPRNHLIDGLVYIFRKDKYIFMHKLGNIMGREINIQSIETLLEKAPARTNQLFQDGVGSYYLLTERYAQKDMLKHYIKIHNILPNEVVKLNYIYNFINQTTIKESLYKGNTVTFNTVTDLYNTLFDSIFNYIDEFNRESSIFTPDHLTEDILEFLKLFSTDPTIKHTSIPITQEVIDNLKKDTNMYVITDVYEKNNCRLFIEYKKYNMGYMGYNPSHHPDHKTAFSIRGHKLDNSMYNYLDVNRYYMSTPYKEKEDLGTHIFLDIPVELPTADVLKELSTNTKITFYTNNDLKIISKRYAQKIDAIKAEKSANTALQAKMNAKLEDLKVNGVPIKINEVTYSSSEIEYQGQILKSDDLVKTWVSDLLRHSLRYIEMETLNFDTITDMFISNVLKKEMDIKGKIGEVDFNIQLNRNKNKNGTYNTRPTINGYRINREELQSCLKRGLCFSEEKAFNSFLSSVSKCSLKMHQYLASGIDLSLFDSFNNERLKLKLPLDRIKNINYLIFENKRFRVKDTQRLINFTNKSDLLEIVNELLSGNVVHDVALTDLKDIIDKGKKSYENAVNKGKELLEKTEKMFNLTPEEQIQLGRGITVKAGYIIKGKLRSYCIDKTNDNKVYTYPDGKYLCMIDKGNQHVGQDVLINRIFALHNDALVSKHIATLNI